MVVVLGSIERFGLVGDRFIDRHVANLVAAA
jgi:hypothetical protein